MNNEKLKIIEKVRSRLNDMLSQTKKEINDAQTEANYHIGAMQSRYDTFKEEAQYLVAAQQIRLINLETQIIQCDELIIKLSSNNCKFTTIDNGAFFSIKNYNNGEVKNYLIVPGGNGTNFLLNNYNVLCVSKDAPIINKYIGLSKDEEPDIDNCDSYVHEVN